jgi:hypothetical protein
VKLVQEFELLRRLEHSNIIKTQRLLLPEGERQTGILVLDYVAGGSLLGIHNWKRLKTKVMVYNSSKVSSHTFW